MASISVSTRDRRDVAALFGSDGQIKSIFRMQQGAVSKADLSEEGPGCPCSRASEELEGIKKLNNERPTLQNQTPRGWRTPDRERQSQNTEV